MCVCLCTTNGVLSANPTMNQKSTNFKYSLAEKGSSIILILNYFKPHIFFQTKTWNQIEQSKSIECRTFKQSSNQHYWISFVSESQLLETDSLIFLTKVHCIYWTSVQQLTRLRGSASYFEIAKNILWIPLIKSR